MPAPYTLTLSPVVGIEDKITTTPDQQLMLTLTPVLKGDRGDGGGTSYIDFDPIASVEIPAQATDGSILHIITNSGIVLGVDVVIDDLLILSNNKTKVTKVTQPVYAPVATSNDYNDLVNLPDIDGKDQAVLTQAKTYSDTNDVAILTALGNCVRFDAVQVLTTPQKDQARSNIEAEKAGVAAGLVAAITPASIGAATEADGVKARSALQAGDVAPVAVTGSFTDLINKPTLPPATRVTTKTVNYVLVAGDSGTIFTDTSAGGAQFTFPTPAAAGNGWEVEIWNETGSASLTTKLNPPTGGQSIDGSTAQLIVYWKQGYRIVSDGTAYFTRAIRATRFYAEGAGTGARARAESVRAIAIGSGANAGSNDALALGAGANAASSTTVAIMGTAVGTDAIAVRGTTSGIREIAIGLGSTTGTVLSSNGGSIAIGYNAIAQRDYAVAIGASSVASQIAEMAFPSWSFAVSNHKEIVLGNNSMTAASTDYLLASNYLNSASSANQIICPASSSVAFDGILVVRRQGSGGTETASWKIEGEMTRQTTGNVSIVASMITPIAGMVPPIGWTPSLVADTTNQCLSLKFNMGTTAMNLRSAAMMRYATLTY